MVEMAMELTYTCGSLQSTTGHIDELVKHIQTNLILISTNYLADAYSSLSLNSDGPY